MKIEVIDLGLIEYEQAWKLPDQYAAEIAEGKRVPECLLSSANSTIHGYLVTVVCGRSQCYTRR